MVCVEALHVKHGPPQTRQIGYLSILAVGVAAITMVSIGRLVGWDFMMIALGVALLVCLILFSLQTVEVRGGAVRIHLGPGIPLKSFLVADIADARPVRNRWYYGWGIRKIEKGWLFNVSGLDAVEVTLRTGRVYRIGTDEPEKLVDAVRRARPA